MRFMPRQLPDPHQGGCRCGRNAAVATPSPPFALGFPRTLLLGALFETRRRSTGEVKHGEVQRFEGVMRLRFRLGHQCGDGPVQIVAG
jgi:hypothetical protein